MISLVATVLWSLVILVWRWGVRTWIPYAVPGFIVLVLAKAGALLQNNLFIFAMIIAICVILILAAFDRLREPYYPHIVGAIGLALLLQTTLISSGLVGTDIHTEYYFYYEALDGWDTTFPHPYNSAVGATVIAPFLTNVLRIPGYWIFKVVFPVLFTFVPFILYFIFRKEFGAKTAFFASVFFIIVPTWAMELIGIPRQMLGELMLALCLFVVIVSRWRLRIRVPLLVVLGILGALFHYTIGYLTVLCLGISGFFLLFFVIAKRRVLFPLKWLGLATIIIFSCSLGYYGAVCQGLPLTCLTTGSGIVQILILDILPSSLPIADATLDIPAYPYIEPGTVDRVLVGGDRTQEEATTNETEVSDNETEVSESEPAGVTTNKTVTNATAVKEVEEAVERSSMFTVFTARFSPLIRTAWGGDFAEANTWGKVFRVFQYLTQLAILVGIVCLVRRRKDYSAEYLSFCYAAILLLVACMFIPHLASLINETRFYHITLFLLAPVFVLGGKAIFRNYRLLTMCLIIPYFLFTSGLVFEITQQTDINRINMPYSVSLSNHRVDMIGVFTRNDMAVRDWATTHDLVKDTYADTHSQLLLWEKAYTYWRDFGVALEAGYFDAGRYIFLSERNNRDRTIILRPTSGGSSSGRRVSYSYEESGLDKVISEGTILYQQGDACILEIKRVPLGQQ